MNRYYNGRQICMATHIDTLTHTHKRTHTSAYIFKNRINSNAYGLLLYYFELLTWHRMCMCVCDGWTRERYTVDRIRGRERKREQKIQRFRFVILTHLNERLGSHIHTTVVYVLHERTTTTHIHSDGKRLQFIRNDFLMNDFRTILLDIHWNIPWKRCQKMAILIRLSLEVCARERESMSIEQYKCNILVDVLLWVKE